MIGLTTTRAIVQRQRPAQLTELAAIPWLGLLSVADRDYVLPEIRVTFANAGDVICRMGRPASYWFGVIEGLLKMSNDNADGKAMTFAGVPSGGWFGEGTVLKRESYRYNISALRDSTVAGISVEAFHWLLEHSLPFNRYLMGQLNERLSQFIAAREVDRICNPEQRVARTLAGLLNPTLYPLAGASNTLTITQQELAYLVGMSRQRVNMALKSLETQGKITLEYGGLRVLDMAHLIAH